MSRRNTGRPSTTIDFEGMIQRGENPLGTISQTANGTVKTGSPGWNTQYEWGRPEAEPVGAWDGNRSGE
jgi:hypothetical protein